LRLKIKIGETVEFELEKSENGYIVKSIKKVER